MPETYRVITTDRAYVDLNDILDYIAARSPQNAARMIDRLVESIENLDFMPGRYPVVAKDPVTGHDIRSMPVQSYLVRYRVEKERKVVYVLSVRHGARDSP